MFASMSWRMMSSASSSGTPRSWMLARVVMSAQPASPYGAISRPSSRSWACRQLSIGDLRWFRRLRGTATRVAWEGGSELAQQVKSLPAASSNWRWARSKGSRSDA